MLFFAEEKVGRIDMLTEDMITKGKGNYMHSGWLCITICIYGVIVIKRLKVIDTEQLLLFVAGG